MYGPIVGRDVSGSPGPRDQHMPIRRTRSEESADLVGEQSVDGLYSVTQNVANCLDMTAIRRLPHFPALCPFDGSGGHSELLGYVSGAEFRGQPGCSQLPCVD